MKKRYSEERIIGFLREAESGIKVADRFYDAMQPREQKLGSKSASLRSRTKHSRANFRPSATNAAVELKPRSRNAR